MAVLFESLKICEYLENILKDTFGPCGLDVMLNSSSGKILITNSGGIIVDSLYIGHPVARVIVDKIKTHYYVAGDGCCSFIIVLTQALREIANRVGITSPAELKTSTLQALLALSKHFISIENELNKLLTPTLQKISMNIDLMKSDQSVVKEALNHAVNTCMNGKFSSGIQKLLTSLLVESITSSFTHRDDLYTNVECLLDDFNQWCVECPGRPVQYSTMDQGFLIPRELATGQEINLPKSGKADFTFVMLQCSLDSSKNTGKAEIQISDLSVYSKTLVHNQITTLSVLKALKEEDIDLLISSENVSDMALHFCRQLGIAVIQMVPMETVSYICKCLNIQPICNLDTVDIQNISSEYKAKGLSCREKVICSQKFVLLCVLQYKIHHILLCGPTQGMVQQYRISLQNALKSIKMSFTESKIVLSFLPGCGSTEFVASQVFDQLGHNTTDGQMRTACDILYKSLLQIPRTLHCNSHHSGDQSFLKVQQKMASSWKKEELLGVDGRKGHAIHPYGKHIYEPYQSKILLLSHLLQCLAMLLRVDNIVGVKCS